MRMPEKNPPGPSQGNHRTAGGADTRQPITRFACCNTCRERTARRSAMTLRHLLATSAWKCFSTKSLYRKHDLVSPREKLLLCTVDVMRSPDCSPDGAFKHKESPLNLEKRSRWDRKCGLSFFSLPSGVVQCNINRNKSSVTNVNYMLMLY